MVRTDHEDGGVLKPESDDSGDTTAVVRKSSPISRRRKPSDKAAVTPPSDDTVAGVQVDLEKPATDTAEADSAETATVESASTADAPTQAVSYRARRGSARTSLQASPSLKRQILPAVGIGAAVLVLIASIVATFVFVVGSSRIEDDRALRASYDQFAQEVVIKMTTLNKENADSMYEFMQEHTSGRAQQQFRESMKQARDLIKADDMKTTTTVVASAVEKADQDAGSVLVVFVWQGTAPEAPQQPDIQTFRARVSITNINDALKMTNFEWVN